MYKTVRTECVTKPKVVIQKAAAKPVSVSKKLDVVPPAVRVNPDDVAFMARVRRGPRAGAREICVSLGWLGLRADKTFGRLLRAGKIAVEGGVVVEVKK